MKTKHGLIRASLIGLVAITLIIASSSRAKAQTTVVWSEGFELGWGNWYADLGTWGIGSPPSGPPSNPLGSRAYSGTNCAGTHVGGVPYPGVDSNLVSPPFTVPPASQHPRLRFWNWFSLKGSASEYGLVNIQPVATGGWDTLVDAFYGTTSGQWTRPSVDLSAYAGKQVRVAFEYRSGSGGTAGGGWCVDQVTLETSPVLSLPLNTPEGFELGWGDWYADLGTWGIGSPPSGPPSNPLGSRAYSGTNCAGTHVGGVPYPGVDSNLVSPPFTVPPTSQHPRLRFWNWFSLKGSASEYGLVNIQPVATGGWDTLVDAFYGTTSGQWTRPSVDLSAYAGKQVRVAFEYRSGSGGTAGGGWCVDEVMVETDTFPPMITQPPASLVVTQGQTATFTVLATGGGLQYQWSLNLTNLLTNGGRISGANSSALFISNVQASDAGLCSVVVSNSAGTVSTNATLTVLVPPSITTTPVSQTVLRGSNVTFTVAATGTLPLGYQWQFNGANLAGQTDTALTLLNVQFTNAGNYSAVVSNLVNMVTSAPPAVLTVLGVPPPWTNADIGDVGRAGSASYSNGVLIVTGSGEDIKGTADDFQFVYQPVTGDCQVVARLLSLQGVDPGAEAGVMVRETVASGSKSVLLARTLNNALMFRRRLVNDDYTWENSSLDTNAVYVWLRLMRMGNTFVAHASTNGVDWRLVWFTTANMASQVEAGLAVTAHQYGAEAKAEFDNVSVGSLTPLSGAWPWPGPIIYLGGEPLLTAGFQPLGGFKILVGGAVGDYFTIRASQDLRAPTASWSMLGTVTNQWGVVDFIDAQALTNGVRFYRAHKVGP